MDDKAAINQHFANNFRQFYSQFVDLKSGSINGQEVSVLCPFHSEKEPSMSINIQSGLFKCFGCGKGGDIYTFYQEHEGVNFKSAINGISEKFGISIAGGNGGGNGRGRQRAPDTGPVSPPVRAMQHAPKQKAKQKPPHTISNTPFKHFKLGTPKAVYKYTDETGAAMYYNCRFEPGDKGRKKTFRQCTKTGLIWSMKSVKVRYPYNLEKFASTEDIYVVNGEKAADLLFEKFGLVGTCSAGGEGNWTSDLAVWFKNKTVYILPDNDAAGEKHLSIVSLALAAVVNEVRVLRLPDLPPKGDFVDWYEKQAPGGRRALFVALCARAEVYRTYKPPDNVCAYSDVGNADRFITQHADDVMFSHVSNKWFTWSGRRWNCDKGGHEVFRRMKETILTIPLEVGLLDDEKAVKKLLAFSIRSQTMSRIKAAIECSSHYREVEADDFDVAPLLFNCQNGTIDLEKGELVRHSRADRITKMSPASFMPDAKCPTWFRFLDQIFLDDAETIAFIQRAVGYSLSAMTSEQCLFFLHGLGANGKTTFINVLMYLLGDYGYTYDFGTFAATNQDMKKNELARLQGSRFIAASEVGMAKRLDEAKIKQVTGNEPVVCRWLYGEFFEYVPTYKIWLAANHEPQIWGGDYAIWRRIKKVPFNATFRKSEQDPHLEKKLIAEIDGILAWAVEGFKLWRGSGLLSSAAIRNATIEYQEGMDLLARFINDACIINGAHRTSAKVIYATYEHWCIEAGEEPISKNLFGRKMAEKGFKRIKSHGERIWQGIGIEDDYQLHFGEQR